MKTWLFLTATAVILVGCNLRTMPIGGRSAVTPTLKVDETAIVETVYAQLTVNAPPTETPRAVTPTNADSPTPAASPTPSLSPTITLTPTPSVPMISATLNTNCRMGPGIVYPVIGYLLVDQSVPVVGRLSTNTWWVIQHPTRAGVVCWVWNQTTVVSGDLSMLPVATPPPTPTPTVTPTSTLTPTITPTVIPATATTPPA